MRVTYILALTALTLLLTLPCPAQESSDANRHVPLGEDVGFECPGGEKPKPRPPGKMIKLGDITRKALALPYPKYPKGAKTASVPEQVKAEVVIDLLSGKIVWARVVNGTPLLREAVKKVVCRTVFAPTNDVPPIKASGFITYTFKGRGRVPPNKGMNRTRNQRPSHPQSFVLAGYPRRYAASLKPIN
jgi:hypothetical protein